MASLSDIGRGILGVASAGLSEVFYYQPKAAADAAEEQAEISKQQAEIQNRVTGLRAQRERAEMLRRQRILRGQVEAQGQATGTSQSSTVVGGLSALQTTTASNVGFSLGAQQAGQQLFALGQRNLDLEKEKGKAMFIASTGQTLFNLGMKAAGGAM